MKHQMHRTILLLAWLALAGLVTGIWAANGLAAAPDIAVPGALAPGATIPAPNAHSPIGTNLGKLGATEMLWLVNQTPRADGWLTQCDESCGYQWNTGEQDQLVLDEAGWVISFGSNPNRQFTHVALALFNGAAHTVPAGDWVVLYDGEATLAYDFAPFVTVVSQSPGRDVLRLDPAQASLLRVRISAINPANHLRNLRILPPGGVCNGDPFRYAPDAAACGAAPFASFEEIYSALRFHPLLLQTLRPYRALRFMQWQGIVDDTSPESWAERSQLSDAIWSGGWDQSPPLELIFELANVLQADPWVNLPYWAGDDYARRFAELAHGRLAGSLSLYLEYSNEVWNGAYPYSVYGNQIEAWAEARWPDATYPDGSPYSGFTKRMNYVGMRSAQICAIWKEVWGADAARVRCVMPGGPWEFPASEALACPLYAAENGGQNCAGQMAAVAAAPYFGGYLNDNLNADGGHHEQLLAWTQEPDGGLNSLFAELRTGDLLQSANAPDGALAAALAVARDNQRVADQYGLDLITYEAGQHLTPLSGPGTSCNDWSNDPACPPYRAIQDLYIAANRDPRMAELYADYLAGWRALGGRLFVHYSAVFLPSGQYGSWGAKESVTQPDATAYKHWALLDFIAANPCWWPGCAAAAEPTPTVTPTAMAGPSATATATATAAPAATATVTPTPGATATASPTASPTASTTATVTPPAPTATVTVTATAAAAAGTRQPVYLPLVNNRTHSP